MLIVRPIISNFAPKFIALVLEGANVRLPLKHFGAEIVGRKAALVPFWSKR
jgi:hypothetical protein